MSLWFVRSDQSTLDTLTFTSQIPNEVTDYYLQRVGFECEDVRLYVPYFLLCF